MPDPGRHGEEPLVGEELADGELVFGLAGDLGVGARFKRQLGEAAVALPLDALEGHRPLPLLAAEEEHLLRGVGEEGDVSEEEEIGVAADRRFLREAWQAPPQPLAVGLQGVDRGLGGGVQPVAEVFREERRDHRPDGELGLRQPAGGEPGEGGDRLVEVAGGVVEDPGDAFEAADDLLRPRAIEGRRLEQPVEEGALRLVDIEVGVAPVGALVVELPPHPGERRADQPVVHLARHRRGISALRRQGMPARLELGQGLPPRRDRRFRPVRRPARWTFDPRNVVSRNRLVYRAPGPEVAGEVGERIGGRPHGRRGEGGEQQGQRERRRQPAAYRQHLKISQIMAIRPYLSAWISQPFAISRGDGAGAGDPGCKTYSLAYMPEKRIIATFRYARHCRELAAELASAVARGSSPLKP